MLLLNLKKNGVKTMNDLIIKNTNNEISDVNSVARMIANETPKLEDLTSEQLEQLAKIVVAQNLTDELKTKAKLAKINYKDEKTIFIMCSSKSGSEHTQSAYLKSLSTLEKYCKKNDIDILQITTKQADDFITSLKGSPNSIRLTVAGISAFYSFLERRYNVIKNSFRGTKSRPVAKTVKDTEIPNESELFTILQNVNELERMAIYIMAYRGLRVGALKNLKVWGTHYQTTSKGKVINGEFPAEVMANVTFINNHTPFEFISTNALKVRIYRATKKLHEKGLITNTYSAHDFRHYFAVSQYLEDRDIYKLSKLLDHSNIAITETYLKTMKVA